jgi:hypothetical protein
MECIHGFRRTALAALSQQAMPKPPGDLLQHLRRTLPVTDKPFAGHGRVVNQAPNLSIQVLDGLGVYQFISKTDITCISWLTSGKAFATMMKQDGD